MGLLVDGSWQDQWYDTKANGGRFVRSQTSFRNRVTADGSTEKHRMGEITARWWLNLPLISAKNSSGRCLLNNRKNQIFSKHLSPVYAAKAWPFPLTLWGAVGLARP